MSGYSVVNQLSSDRKIPSLRKNVDILGGDKSKIKEINGNLISNITKLLDSLIESARVKRNVGRSKSPSKYHTKLLPLNITNIYPLNIEFLFQTLKPASVGNSEVAGFPIRSEENEKDTKICELLTFSSTTLDEEDTYIFCNKNNSGKSIFIMSDFSGTTSINTLNDVERSRKLNGQEACSLELGQELMTSTIYSKNKIRRYSRMLQPIYRKKASRYQKILSTKTKNTPGKLSLNIDVLNHKDKHPFLKDSLSNSVRVINALPVYKKAVYSQEERSLNVDKELQIENGMIYHDVKNEYFEPNNQEMDQNEKSIADKGVKYKPIYQLSNLTEIICTETLLKETTKHYSSENYKNHTSAICTTLMTTTCVHEKSTNCSQIMICHTKPIKTTPKPGNCILLFRNVTSSTTCDFVSVEGTGDSHILSNETKTTTHRAKGFHCHHHFKNHTDHREHHYDPKKLEIKRKKKNKNRYGDEYQKKNKYIEEYWAKLPEPMKSAYLISYGHKIKNMVDKDINSLSKTLQTIVIPRKEQQK